VKVVILAMFVGGVTGDSEDVLMFWPHKKIQKSMNHENPNICHLSSPFLS
jgi:hypothetical protein